MPSSSDNIRRMKAEADGGLFSKIGKVSGEVWDAMPWNDRIQPIS